MERGKQELPLVSSLCVSGFVAGRAGCPAGSAPVLLSQPVGPHSCGRAAALVHTDNSLHRYAAATLTQPPPVTAAHIQ